MARPLHDRHGYPCAGSAASDLRDAQPYGYLPVQEYCVEVAAAGPLFQRGLDLRSVDHPVPDPTR
eukprot:13815062-Alexandrium_andersonii.AAC.1